MGRNGEMANPCSGAEALALLPAGVYRAGTSRCRWCALTAPLHPCLCHRNPGLQGHRRCVSVALSSRSPAPGVTRQAWPLGSPDFPQPALTANPRTGVRGRQADRSRSPRLLTVLTVPIPPCWALAWLACTIPPGWLLLLLGAWADAGACAGRLLPIGVNREADPAWEDQRRPSP